MPLSYLRGILERCLAESNRCSRFCRPVPNRSAKAPFPYWDCKYSDFYRICKIIFTIFRLLTLWDVEKRYRDEGFPDFSLNRLAPK